MHINTTLIGTDFTPNPVRPTGAEGQTLYYITDTDALYLDHKQYYDKRTGYLNTRFTPSEGKGVLSDLAWYVNYLELNYILLATFMAENPGKQLPVMNMLNIGYIPIGFAPSFISDINPFIVKLLELRKVPYVIKHAVVMGNMYYKTDNSDIWVSKLDAAEYLGCTPEEVTFPELLGGLLQNG